MADAEYDVVVIGSGIKALVTAMYLAKYSDLEVCIVEQRHELGGGIQVREQSAPGFISDVCASELFSYYFTPIYWDFPDFEEKGGVFKSYPAETSLLFPDNTSLTMYSYDEDPDGTRTAAEIARVGCQEDADTFLRMNHVYHNEGLFDAFMNRYYTLPPENEHDTAIWKWLENHFKKPDAIFDQRWPWLSAAQIVMECWKSEAMRYLSIWWLGNQAADSWKAGGANALMLLFPERGAMNAVGGTHSVIHAFVRMYLENGGKFFTNSKVDKVIIENGTAKGVRLTDGSEIKARKMVVSGALFNELFLDMVGREHLSSTFVKKIDAVNAEPLMINWYTWALHEAPKFTAAETSPIVNTVHEILLGTGSAEEILQREALRCAGYELPGSSAITVIHNGSDLDETRAPRGKDTMLTTERTVTKQFRTEREWMEYKKRDPERVLEVINRFAPNMTWDNVIGVDPNTPWDQAFWHKFPVDGMYGWNSAYGVYGPLPEIADHRTPIKDLYITGAAWGFGMYNAGCYQGYLCYKAIADDFDLGKPWKDREW